ncbi:MAG TPA: class I SAM-dependent methyltransferase [bacterium]|nr:class I SAM-dependent methyltransferase [bacterium]
MAEAPILAQGWTDYSLLDAGDGMKLERWGRWTLARPDPQALWPPAGPWKDWHAWYHRSSQGGGAWEKRLELPEEWSVAWGELKFKVRPTDFKHTGIFPEQAANWGWLMEQARAAKPMKVLNLFAYTGAATCALASAGAEVTHVDAAKGMVAWAKENAALNGLQEAPVRWLVDDCQKFVDREIRRGTLYEGLILDPPSYGRGKEGEAWKLEKHLWPLLKSCARLMSPRARFVVLNAYTTGLSPLVLEHLLASMMAGRAGSASAAELCLPIAGGGLLPCGATARWCAL